MNSRNTDCSRIEQLILLEHSNEISAGEADELRAHVASCGQCRKYRDELKPLLAGAKQALRTGEPSPAAIRAIVSKGGAQKEHALISFPGLARWATAVAASALLMTGVWLTVRHNQPETGGGNKPTPAVNAVKAPVLDNLHTAHSLVEVAASPSTSHTETSDRARDERMKALATELLMLEGFYVEEAELENINGLGEPDATDLQSHSNGAFPAGRSA